MDKSGLAAPGWTRWEKHKQRALVGLAVVAGALIASAPRNERRLFLLPVEPMAFSAVAAPEPTALRSPIMGYLDDGCAPDVRDGMSGGFDRAVDNNDCGRGRKRQKTATTEKPIVPAAYFATPETPDTPGAIDTSPLLALQDLEAVPLDLPDLRPTFFGLPIRQTAVTPPVLLASVPEPSSWLMLIAGFGMTGAALRARRVSVTALA